MQRRIVIYAAVLLLGSAVLVRLGPVLTRAAQGRETAPQTATEPAFYVSHGFGEEQDFLPQATEPPAPVTPILASSDPGPKPYPEQWDLTGGKVVQVRYGRYSGERFFNLDTAGQVQNETSVTNDVLAAESRLLPEFRIRTDGTPQVLIMHTHTTESFEPYERESYDASFNYRTTDNARNMVMVGDHIAAKLAEAGIGVIHSDAVHDYPSYTGSYARSAETVRGILAQYPDIKVVLDIHRDAIGGDGVIKQPVVEIAGRKAAQVMIISGCDDGTMDMPDYMQNFRLASLLQQQMETDWPGLTRPVLFDYRKYNQNLTTGSLLIEVGSNGNTLEQAAYAGDLIGSSLAAALLGLKEETECTQGASLPE